MTQEDEFLLDAQKALQYAVNMLVVALERPEKRELAVKLARSALASAERCLKVREIDLEVKELSE